MGKFCAQYKKQLLLAGGLCLVCLVLALPFASSDLVAGHDSIFHLLRLEGLARAIRGGAPLPVRVYPFFLNSYGYACGLFYADVFLYLPALLRAFVLGPELAFKFLMLACCGAGAVTAFFAGRGIGRSPVAGAATAVLYSLCQYHMANLYIRSAVGEVQAMVFVPLVFWGLYDLTEEKCRKPWLLCVAFTGLLLSHTISLALCGLAALVWVAVRLPRVLHLPTIGKMALAVAICLGISCTYWLPMLEQFASNTFKVSEEPLTTLAQNWLYWGDIFSPRSFTGLGVAFLVGLPLCAVGCAVLRRASAPGWGLIAVGAVLVVILRPGFPWAAVDKTFLGSIQFTWRLNLLSQFFFSLGIALNLSAWQLTARQAAAAVAACFVLGCANLACLWGTMPEQCNYSSTYFDAPGETFYLVGQEWVPAGVDIYAFAQEPTGQYTNEQGAFLGDQQANGSFVFAFDGTPGAYGIPKLWYKGYAAYLTGADGTRVDIPLHADGAGRVELEVPQGLPAGTMTVYYRGTSLQTISLAVSLGTVLALAGWAVLRRKKAQGG